MGYDLEQLGTTGFQDLAAALAIQLFGNGVVVMGAGPDGGRDMYLDGQLQWTSGNNAGETWNGYTVFQVKQKAQLAARADANSSWLWSEIRKELVHWADPEYGRDPVPDHMIIMTNVPLSPAPGAGGHDLLQANIKRYVENLADDSKDVSDEDRYARETKHRRLSKIKHWRFLDGNQIQALLSLYPGIRRAFKGFLTAADVFANLAEFTDKLPLDQLEPGLRAHARTALTGEGLIYFDEAGSGDRRGIPVHDIAIDLPVLYAGGMKRSSVVQYVLQRAEHVLKPSVTTLAAPRHLVITGAPGNGKTTISKFLVQAFRAAMLDGAADLSADQAHAIAATDLALRRFGRALPKHRRWPMRVDLAEYAEEGGLLEESTLLKWISRKVSARSNLGEVSPRALHSWMQQWSWFLVLDGLDEVTEPETRKRLIRQVTEFVNDAEAENCDVLVVLTTRPMGYTENIAPTQFERIDLDYLLPDEAVRYGISATRLRFGSDLERVEKIVRQLRVAAKDEALRNLLRTPLQVLILTIIVDGAGQLSPDRYSLFWGYYETVFKRERDKPGGLHRLLQEYGQQIQQLHERVGFELHVRSEAGDRSYATLSAKELREIVWQVLDEAGFEPAGKGKDLLEKFFQAATQRLVLIAPRGNDDGYGFDVRSLQELMAAMHLTTGRLETVVERLRRAAASPHWRNSWIFAAGHLFSTPQKHQHEAVVLLVEALDHDMHGRLSNVAPVGPRLALELIDDGMARSLPVWRGRLIRHGLRVLAEPLNQELPAVARVLVRYADSGNVQRAEVAEGLRDALGRDHFRRTTAELIQAQIPAIVEEIGASLETLALSRALKHPGQAAAREPSDGWADFRAELETYPADAFAVELLLEAAAALVSMAAKGDRVDDPEIQAVISSLQNENTAEAIDSALAYVAPHEPLLVATVQNKVLPAINRAPIGGLLKD